METTESRKSIVYQIPILKGVCILGVIAIHISDYSQQMSRFSWLTGGLLLIDGLARFSVPVFIILSGFYISLNPRNENAFPFYRRTLKFLLIPYIIYSIFYSVLRFRSGISITLFIKNLLLASASPHLWFSLAIIQLYLLHPFLYRYYRKCEHRGVFMIVAFAIQVLWTVLFSIFLPNPDAQLAGYGALARLGKFLFPSNIGYFVLGYYLVGHSEEATGWLKRRASIYVAMPIWIVGAAGLGLYLAIPMSRGTQYASIPNAYLAQSLILPFMAIAAAATILIFSQSHFRGQAVARKIFYPLGLYSYGIYYLNPFVVKTISWGIRRVRCLIFDNIAYYLLLFLIVPIASLVAVRILSKLPVGKYLA